MEGEKNRPKPNHLIGEKSPYLLQHAYNPVDWHPWGEEAFELARRENKPIFLSIGYSTCHWCHVMAEESFEDPEVAALLNETFVPIKVDREERPDIDAVYMEACLSLTGTGGWPLNVILTPERLPFYAATYIPKESRFGMTGLFELVPRIQKLWADQRKDVVASADEIRERLIRAQTGRKTGTEPGIDLIHRTYRELIRRYDQNNAGFDNAPKFPAPHTLQFLIRYWSETGEEKALDMAEETLRAIRRGGIFDQIGYGIHRYTTDAEWVVPHFEKMLYDQAFLALACTEAYEATREPFYREVADEVFEYVLRDLQSPDGAFYTAEDADSEGVEGKFYLWTAEDVEALLGPADTDLFVRAYGIGHSLKSEGPVPGVNILHQRVPVADLAEEFAMREEEVRTKLEDARKILLSARSHRPRPSVDDKVLLDWNAFMIAALARAGAVFDEERYIEAAETATGFLIGRMRDEDGKLFHRYRDGETAVPGMLNDYAALVWALTELYPATFDGTYLREARLLADRMIDLFWDEAEGGFFTSPRGGEALILRRKEAYDGAVPSGNSLALTALLTLYRLTGSTRYAQIASSGLGAFSTMASERPSSYAGYMDALLSALSHSYEVVVAGERDDKRTTQFLDVLKGYYLPYTSVVLRDRQNETVLNEVAPHTREMDLDRGKPVTYLCRGPACEQPVTDTSTLREVIAGERVPWGKDYMEQIMKRG
ncbi:thioredoxin domain-containing protein [Methanofollis formosanus]|uniref:Thioredoxin domain-containing protein n=1 Tax=Methanofollis formosanus TaxID=299308 RepID=A0A8G1EEL0_9EURY|nr:thioredoxin domain-containing protein [Methanofollis formosanus]QYZ78208.1 thioredoxin domain-containing protein [Methanofollis formosanus]